MMAEAPVWHGTNVERDAFNAALAANCECQFMLGVRQTTCPPHKALLEDQRWLDGMLFVHRIREKLIREEGVEISL